MVLMSQMLNTLKKDQKNFVTNQYKKKKKRLLFQSSDILLTKVA